VPKAAVVSVLPDYPAFVCAFAKNMRCKL